MRIQREKIIDTSAAQAWEVFGERFAQISDWAESIVASSLEGELGQGAVRTCELKQVGAIPPGSIQEELTHFDRDGKALTYAVLSGLPGFMKNVSNAWTIEEAGAGKTRLVSDLNIDIAWWAFPLAPMVKKQLTTAIGKVMDQLEAASSASAAKAD